METQGQMMTETVTAEQMRALERAAMDSGSVTGLELMERAGQGVAEAIMAHWPDARRAVVLCGPGNNGGDGFVVARLLADSGWEVEALFHGAADRLPPDARTNHDRWAATGAVGPLTLGAVKQAGEPDVWVDAIFGIGLSRRPTGELERVLCHLAGHGGDRMTLQPKLVAVDVPSGLDADTGEIPGKGAGEWAPPCPFCALTVTFHRAKPGHLRGEGPEHCGKLIVKDIGL
ncbi:NAD(P)H-hydrate epimerase [Sagittula sp.]|uniref:NAD(P)H-hydrate epimerase n=1 Tax=Sagittula sp. TaxID=2038081 RepID=UPI0035176B47